MYSNNTLYKKRMWDERGTLCTDFVLETLQMAIYSAMTLTILHETSNRLTSYLQKIYLV